MTKTQEVLDFLKDIPGVQTIGQRVPLDDLVVYVLNKKVKKLVEERLIGKDFGVRVDVTVFGTIAPLGPV